MVEAGGLTEREDTIFLDARVVRNRFFHSNTSLYTPETIKNPVSRRRPGVQDCTRNLLPENQETLATVRSSYKKQLNCLCVVV